MTARGGPVPAHSPPISALDDVVRRISGVSTLPQIALKVNAVAADADSDVNDLRRVIEADPALSAKLVRTVNSAAYGRRSRIADLSQAIGFLGINQVRNLAFALSVSRIFRTEQHIGSYRRSLLWRHQVAVGLCARLIALRCQLPAYEDCFLGGLLHDIGIILEDQYAHEAFGELMKKLQPDRPLVEQENAVLGFNHTQLGHRMAELWQFPESIQAAIRDHHDPRSDAGRSQLLHCVQLANFICTAKGITAVGLQVPLPSRAPLENLRLGLRDIEVLALDLDEELARHEALFELR